MNRECRLLQSYKRPRSSVLKDASSTVADLEEVVSADPFKSIGR